MAKIKKSQASPKPLPSNITNSQRLIPISSRSASKVVAFLLSESGTTCEEMDLHFVGKKKISSLHAAFFDDPSPTDCITFPYSSPESPDYTFLGEVFVCPMVAKEYVSQHGGDLYEEITLYIIHGFLHLLGYNDQTENEKLEMRRLEKKWLSALAKNHLLVTP